MAREWVRFACGHEGWAHAVGRPIDRYRMLAWYRLYGQCPGCLANGPKPSVLVDQFGDVVRTFVLGAQPIEGALQERGYRLDATTGAWMREFPIGWFPKAYRELLDLGAVPHPLAVGAIEAICELVEG